ncbi:ABC transporter permease subunit [Sagittula stellata]|uniref:Peptide/opine/nickel ABC transporter (PepT) family, permease protein n=1 Tax=Sagittula stellata (strain ATCC 700073 / DSM 11524 / E-37) TaxID=388399 RepID=A3K351_SAGS3|nr:ABC transporter permease subunit [Sagittula stellata]EBA08610.1 peptide/opine/nickel ABC transporter (PepT) family, permease protein [Sagittula stellata E-37]
MIRAIAVVLAASPGFWVAKPLVTFFAVGLGWLPACCATPPGQLATEVSLADRWRHMILPVATLSVVGIAPLVLHTRQSLTAFLDSPAGRHLSTHGARRAAPFDPRRPPCGWPSAPACSTRPGSR